MFQRLVTDLILKVAAIGNLRLVSDCHPGEQGSGVGAVRSGHAAAVLPGPDRADRAAQISHR